jgi:hypothetical protein
MSDRQTDAARTVPGVQNVHDTVAEDERLFQDVELIDGGGCSVRIPNIKPC